MSNSQRMILLASLVGLLVFVKLSCNGDTSGRPPLGYVKGRVTLDGKPLTGVIITFNPDIGRPASSLVDKDGNYEIQYTYKVNGTKIGSNTVSFGWPTGAGGPGIQEKYAGKSELKVEIKKGKNVFDFALDPVPPPTKPAKPGVTSPPEGTPTVD